MASIVDRSDVRRVAMFLVLASLVLAPSMVRAQAQEATILGQVTDESGAVLPGVTVTVSGPALLVRQIVSVTDARGEYRVTPLPLGTYTVEYTLQGFQTLRREGVRLTTGFVARMDVALKLGSVAESITVSGQSPVVDITTTTAGTKLTSELLETIPTGRNGLTSLLNMGAGVRPGPDFGQLNQSNPIYRAFGRDNNAWVTIEGVATTSPWSSANGLGSVLLYEATEEATVQTIGNSADSPTSGIQLSVITKSGGNDFHGGVTLSQFASWMQDDNVDATLAAQGITTNKVVERWDRGGDLGGRILRDRLWFYGSVKKRRDASPIIGLILPDGSQGVNKFTEPILNGKVTYQINAAQKLIGWRQWGEKRTGAANATRFTDWDSRGYHKTRNSAHKIEYQLAKGNKFLSLQYGEWATNGGPHNAFTDAPSTTDQVTSRITGANIDKGVISDYGRYDTRGALNWYKPDMLFGNHDFKMGFNYQIARGDNLTIDRGAAGNYQLIFRSGAPFQVAARNNPVSPLSNVEYLGLYLQDSWTMSRRLTLNLGVRYADDQAYIPRNCREAAPAPFATLYPAECFDRIAMKSWHPLTPRLHVSYDVGGDGKTVIKGGWGLFANMHGVDELLVANPIADISTVFRWTDLNSDRLFQAGEANLDPNGSDFVSRTPSANAALVGLVQNQDLQEPGSHEFSMSLERQIMPDLGVRVSGVFAYNFNTLRLENTLRPYSAYNIPITNPDPGPDGRLGTADDTGRTITYYDFPASLAGLAFQRPMFINDSNSDANYKSFEVAASKRLSHRWQLLASYSATKTHNPVVADITGNKVTTVATYTPNAEIFGADETWEWQTRLTGSYTLPADVIVSGNFVNMSGSPWARMVSFTGGRQIPSIRLRVEPIGAQRVPSANLLSVRAEKGIRLRGNHQVRLRAQVFNALNINTVTVQTQNRIDINQQAGSTFGQPTVIASPRVGEVGITYSF